MGNLLVVRGSGARHPDWPAAAEKVLGRGDIQARIGEEGRGRGRVQYRARATCVWYCGSCAWA
jgi:hypothetical protein